MHVVGRALDIALSGELISSVKQQIATFRSNTDLYHGIWYQEVVDLAQELGVQPSIPRVAARQSLRNNVPAENADVYYKRTITIPVLGEKNSE